MSSDAVVRKKTGQATMVVATMCTVLAIGLFSTAQMRRSAAIEAQTAKASQCETRIRAVGASVVTAGPGESYRVRWSGLEGGVTRMAEASVVALACPGWKLDSFCMGQACAVPGLELTLRRVDEG